MPNVATQLLDVLHADPTRPAIQNGDDRSLSFEQLRHMCLGVAAHMAERGVSQGERVLIQVPNGPLFVAVVVGALWLGAVPVLIDPAVGPDVYRRCVVKAAPSLGRSRRACA